MEESGRERRGSTTGSTPRTGRSCSSRRSPTQVVAPGRAVGIRRDATWNVPEPELALVLSSRGRDRRLHDRQRHELARHRGREPAVPAAGQDLRRRRARSARAITLGGSMPQRTSLEDSRSTSGARQRGVRRRRPTLGRRWRAASRTWPTSCFARQTFPHGAVLLTGTGVVPPDEFTLAGRGRRRDRGHRDRRPEQPGGRALM